MLPANSLSFLSSYLLPSNLVPFPEVVVRRVTLGKMHDFGESKISSNGFYIRNLAHIRQL